VRACARLSLEAGEPLVGTASRVETWFLLEYPLPWEERAFLESSLPPPVKARLSALLESIPLSRLLFIKRGTAQAQSQIAFYIVQSKDAGSLLYDCPLGDYEDLLELDVPSFVAGDSAVSDRLSQERLFLVCTNGKRDSCCARFGLPLFRAARKSDERHFWQCSHVGGHRFAANLLCFPHGVYYGRVNIRQARTIVSEYRDGRVCLENYRGRSCHSPATQAVEAHLRTRTGVLDLDSFRLGMVEEIPHNRWRIEFVSSGDGRVHRLQVRAIPSRERLFVSCKGDKEEPVTRYQLEDYVVL
jgi:hypothetical protein